MKQLSLSAFLLIFLHINACTQYAGVAKPQPGNISFSLKNGSLLPKKITVISYRPDETGNGTRGVLLAPLGSRSFQFPAGTKIYLADQKQVNTVMSGASITDQPPFLTVKPEDEGKSFKIN